MRRRRKQTLWYYRYRFTFLPGLTVANSHKHYEFVTFKQYGRGWKDGHDR